ncbi:MAG: DNA polymerase I [Actinomycetota bacterium]
MSTDAINPSGEILLIDGYSLAFRAFFALPESITREDGTPTNALYGLAAMTIKVIEEEKPSRVIVAWDPPGKTFRDEIYPEYKAGRSATPEAFKAQSPYFRPLMEAFGAVNIEKEGFEADDVIGTLARRASDAGQRVTILTGDRDALQLVDANVSVLATGRGVTDTTRYDEAKVEERYGVPPPKMPDLRGMIGDSSDNLPGVPGIGEKTAAQLMAKYGSLEEILAHADEQTPKRRENLTEHADMARLCRDLSVIDVNVPLDLEPGDAPLITRDAARLAALQAAFQEFEFKTLARRVAELAGEAPEGGAADGDAATGGTAPAIEVQEESPEALAMSLAGGEAAAIALAGDALAVVAGDGPARAVALGEGADPAIGPVVSAAPWSAHDAKAILRRGRLDGPLPEHDTMIAAYLLQPRRRQDLLDELAEEEGVAARAEGAGDDACAAAAGAASVRDLRPIQEQRMSDEGLGPLFHDIEMPLIGVLVSMENLGVAIDVPRLEEIQQQMQAEIAELTEKIHDLASGPFTIDSPKQLAEVLFERLGLPAGRKGKTGYSTDRRVLRSLEDKHPIVPLVVRYRELVKLEGTYLAPLPGLVDPADGRIHTTFNQTVAETGRLSSTNPNLQNIPVRTEAGREIRDAFVAGGGFTLMSCDYSQVELRILAHCSGEPALRDAFAEGRDVHAATASEVFGVPLDEMDREVRDRAKAVNFGIIYGISDFGLAEQLAIPRADAREYIETYLARYPRVEAFVASTIAQATEDGYVTTLLGRRRAIPELTARTQQQRQLGERLAVNTVIQGSAADIIKIAMIRAYAALAESGTGARMVLQIHDELLVECPPDAVDPVRAIVVDAMTGAYDLDPPLAVEVGVGPTWLKAKA